MTSEEKADQEALKLLQTSVEKLRAESNYLSRANIDQNLESEELSVPMFPMNGNPRNPYIHGIDNILKIYRRMLRSVMPSYPTYFQHVISEAIKYSFASHMNRRQAKKAAETKGKEYVVLILLSDCCIVDQVETARLIVEISLIRT